MRPEQKDDEAKVADGSMSLEEFFLTHYGQRYSDLKPSKEAEVNIAKAWDSS